MGFHLHHSMLVGILHAMGDALSEIEGLNARQHKALREAVDYLAERIPPE